ncbi:MAG: type IV pilus modification protein PilV [Gammaproteobacteria bacterium]|nr:MAG: type IV pilus modification protein PilV [Gammaproteobacteria bacterium]TLY88532.1 MAG: type IV pilus modification protein PilV [Gammaproteobacteria bacterium]
MKRAAAGAHSRGFSLVEVMVAVIVICVGMLGIAKMEALSVSNTTTARLRSLAAIEAASLAAAMHSNRQYWANTALPFDLALNAGVISSTSDPALATQAMTDAATVPDDVCFGAQCAPLPLAAFDVARWSTNLTGLLPNPTANINCPASPGVAAPPTCTITLSWSEKAVAINQQETTALANAQFQVPTYTLYVEP